MRGNFLWPGIFIVFIVLLSLSSCFVVNQVQQAIVLQFGEVVRTSVGPGLHFKMPLLQEVVYFDNRVLNIETDRREVIASDQKRLVIDAYAKYRITDPVVFLQSVRTEANLRSRVASIIESASRQEISKVSLNCLLSDCRNKVSGYIEDITKMKAKNFGVEIIDVRVRRIDLPIKNTEAIFQRMQTEREKEAKEIRAFGFEEEQKIKSLADKTKKVLVSDANRKAELIRGEGDAKALEIYNDTFKVDPEFFKFYYHMRLYKDIISGDNTSIVLGSDNELFKFLFKKKDE